MFPFIVALHFLVYSLLAIAALFALRRFVFLVTLLRPQSPIANAERTVLHLPTVLVLIPARNESSTLPATLAALDALDYPLDRLRVVLINDGSTDDTALRMQAAVQTRPHWHLHSLSTNLGKPAALNSALSAHAFGDFLYVLDADHQPAPDCLKRLVSAFTEAQVGGVSGQMRVSNPIASPAAYYAAIESLVNQFVTMRGKDRLRLGPALLGSNSAYRRSALKTVGGFRAGAYLEDSDLTLALYGAGFSTRYLPEAVSHHHAPTSVRGYIKQHIRWGRGFNDVARTHLTQLLRDKRLSWSMRTELALFSLGYLDRLALLGLVGLWMLNTVAGGGLLPNLPLQIGIALSLGLPLMQIVAVLVFDHAPPSLWIRLPWVPIFFALDAGVAVYSVVVSLLNRPRIWYQTERA
jgi:cellulose synthase/poly-beta-1,6-N-acetylglucosamine synthase-like glycosyltransferase